MKYKVEFDIDFRRNPYTGKYIVIEGIDGSGKTTQAQRLAQYFKSSGKSVFLTKEPSDEGEIGTLIRDVLKAKVKIPYAALQFLFSADRSVRHETVTLPALKAGKIVISDRCFWSVIPYGIMDREGEKYDYKTAQVLLVAQGLLSHYHQFVVPDSTFYLDISVDAAMARLSKMDKVREIYERRSKLEKIVQGYKWLIAQFPQEFTIINAEQPVEKVTNDIVAKIQNL